MTTKLRTKRRAVSAAALLAALALGGCGGTAAGDDDGIASANHAGASGHSPSPTPSLSEDERRLKFAECMREQGVEMEDPGTSGAGAVRVHAGAGKGKGDKIGNAMEKCKIYAPNGGERVKLNPEQVKQMREVAKCMRANGVPDFPDPEQDGRVTFRGGRGIKLDKDAFKNAQEKCRQYAPKLGEWAAK